MPTADDFITLLDAESERYTKVAVAVALENSTLFVWAKDPNRLSLLKQVLDAGGLLVGVLGFTQQTTEHGTTVTVKTAKVLDEEWVDAYLDELLAKTLHKTWGTSSIEMDRKKFKTP
jgi:hypothetical protein